MYQRILVPVDGSATSMLGLHEAIGLAADQSARLCILNVVDDLILMPAADGFAMTGMDDLIARLTAEGRTALDIGAALADKRKVRVECVQFESRGKPISDLVLKQARKWSADLIVMGTHGRRGLNRVLMGSDAERVLREATVPVLMVRGEKLKRAQKKSARSRKVAVPPSKAAPARRRKAA